ncbi:hypothetical protein HHI36_004847 [Cryptolaemus montrouzieri]|uniref:BZIP domain-containing protein n=1 Tax=Cryptolaemus montrouzieri TaxID=559131 RepID=A0ABD2NSE9_9CUCU
MPRLQIQHTQKRQAASPHFTPPCSDDEGASHPEPNRRIASALERSTIQRNRRNHLIRKREKQIIRLKGENRRLKKKLQQLKKSPIKWPNSKLLSDVGTKCRRNKEDVVIW